MRFPSLGSIPILPWFLSASHQGGRQELKAPLETEKTNNMRKAKKVKPYVVKRKGKYSPTQYVTEAQLYNVLGKLITEARGFWKPDPQFEEKLDKDTVIELLIQLNKAKVLRVKDIAAYVGISTASVSCWLTGVNFPAKRHMGRLYELISATREGKDVRTL